MSTNMKSPEEIMKELYRYDKVADYLPDLQGLNEDQLSFYKEQGYIAVQSVLNDNEIQAAAQALLNMLHISDRGGKIQFTKPREELHTDQERELNVRKIYEFVNHVEELRAIAEHPGILSVLERIFGEKPVLVQDMALLKPPHGGGEKPWHQDMAYGGLAFDKAVCGVWIALDEAGIDNGCMHIIPRSHMDGATPHYAVRDWQLCDTAVAVEQDVVVPLPPGGLLFFHGLLKHGTPSNFSPKRRRALQFHYAPESAVKLSPKEYKRFFTNEMTGAEC